MLIEPSPDFPRRQWLRHAEDADILDTTDRTGPECRDGVPWATMYPTGAARSRARCAAVAERVELVHMAQPFHAASAWRLFVPDRVALDPRFPGERHRKRPIKSLGRPDEKGLVGPWATARDNQAEPARLGVECHFALFRN